MVNIVNVYNDKNNYPIIKIEKQLDIDGTNLSIEGSVSILRQAFNLDQMQREYACIMGYDANMTCTGIFLISIGSTRHCYFYNKSIAVFLLLTNSENFILFHNHPNGDLEVSENDKNALNAIKFLASILEVNFIDSVIVTKRGWRTIEGGVIDELDKEDVF